MSSQISTNPQTLAGLIASLTASSNPALTWYGTERIELSGPVLARWLAKTENLLQEEFPFGLATYRLELPLSWRAFPWYVCARFRELTPPDGGEEPDLLITADPASSAAEVTVAQPLGSLDMAWPGVLPSGALDGASDVMAQADQLLNSPTGTLASDLSDDDEPGAALIYEATPSHAYERALMAILAGRRAIMVSPEAYGAGDLQRLRAQEGVL